MNPAHASTQKRTAAGRPGTGRFEAEGGPEAEITLKAPYDMSPEASTARRSAVVRSVRNSHAGEQCPTSNKVVQLQWHKGEHIDRTPSQMKGTVTGTYRCWSCGTENTSVSAQILRNSPYTWHFQPHTVPAN